MIAPSVEPLDTARHNRGAFSCGQADLDLYLRRQAGQDARRNVAAPFVATLPGTDTVVGYYTLSAHSIALHALPPEAARQLPKYPAVPVTLLGRLAVDHRHQGKKLGEFLLLDALKRSLTSSRDIASFAVIVDAIDDRARAFYEHFEFIPFPEQPLRLFLPMATIAVLFK